MATTKTNTLESLVINLDKAEQNLIDAKAALDSALKAEKPGTTFYLNEIPYQIVEGKEGGNKMQCLWSARAIALHKGLPVPVIKRRAPRTKPNEA